MRAEYAADLTNRHARFAKSGNSPIRTIASVPSGSDYAWTEAMMRIAGKNIVAGEVGHRARPALTATDDPAIGH
jgi:alpha-N-arabinofuranosidase